MYTAFLPHITLSNLLLNNQITIRFFQPNLEVGRTHHALQRLQCIASRCFALCVGSGPDTRLTRYRQAPFRHASNKLFTKHLQVLFFWKPIHFLTVHCIKYTIDTERTTPSYSIIMQRADHIGIFQTLLENCDHSIPLSIMHNPSLALHNCNTKRVTVEHSITT